MGTQGNWWGACAAWAALAGLWGVPWPACGTPVFVSASARAEASASLGSSPAVVHVDGITFVAPAGHARLDASALARSNSVGDDSQLQARMQVETWWNGPDQGSVALDQSFGGVSEFSSGLAMTGSVDLWAYTFQVDRDARLRLQYDVHVDAATGGAGSGGFRVLVGRTVVSELSVGSHGVLDLELDAGETYTVSLRNVIAGYRLAYGGRFAAGHQGFFQWSIEDLPAPPPAAVPEPAGLPLLALTCVAAAAARRRRAGFSRAR